MFLFFARYGITDCWGLLFITTTLHAKMFGTGQSAVLSLPSKCRLQILVFSLTPIGFLILINYLCLRTGLEAGDGILPHETLPYQSS